MATKSPLKVMKNVFYFTLKTLFLLEIFKFLSWLFDLVAKRLDKKDKVNFKFYNVTAWLTNSYNTYISQYFKRQRQSDHEIWSVNGMQHEEHFSWKIVQSVLQKLFPDTFLKSQNWAYHWINICGLSKYIKITL